MGISQGKKCHDALFSSNISAMSYTIFKKAICWFAKQVKSKKVLLFISSRNSLKEMQGKRPRIKRNKINRYKISIKSASCPHYSEDITTGVANLSPTMRQLFIIRFQMRHDLHKSWRKYFPPMSRLFTKTKICLRL